MLAFGGGHIPGAMHIGDRPELSVWAGDMLDYDKPILLVVEDEAQLDSIAWLFANVGLTDFAGYLAGGMKAWENSGLPLERLPQLPVQELAQRRQEFQVLDVRAPDEFEKNHIAGAKHKYVAEMRNGVNGELGIDPAKPVAQLVDLLHVEPEFSVDEASVLATSDGKRFRLPQGDAAYAHGSRTSLVTFWLTARYLRNSVGIGSCERFFYANVDTPADTCTIQLSNK
ncbi:rhodanese-like domain-containing protein [Rhodopirellula sp. JC639]|uniref:rhodanese-like domain-containing protein n=1 Tax=Stieleria mannarensis TaxID=2755585 RepID=UPI00336A2558